MNATVNPMIFSLTGNAKVSITEISHAPRGATAAKILDFPVNSGGDARKRMMKVNELIDVGEVVTVKWTDAKGKSRSTCSHTEPKISKSDMTPDQQLDILAINPKANYMIFGSVDAKNQTLLHNQIAGENLKGKLIEFFNAGYRFFTLSDGNAIKSITIRDNRKPEEKPQLFTIGKHEFTYAFRSSERQDRTDIFCDTIDPSILLVRLDNGLKWFPKKTFNDKQAIANKVTRGAWINGKVEISVVASALAQVVKGDVFIDGKQLHRNTGETVKMQESFLKWAEPKQENGKIAVSATLPDDSKLTLVTINGIAYVKLADQHVQNFKDHFTGSTSTASNDGYTVITYAVNHPMPIAIDNHFRTWLEKETQPVKDVFSLFD